MKSALEWRCQTKYNVKYIDTDINDLSSLELGSFDAVIALNSLYYLDEKDIERTIRHVADLSDLFLIQCNTRDHKKDLGRRSTPSYMKRALERNGFPMDIRAIICR